MKYESRYHWRIKWAGRWTTTKIRYTEEAIRREHPEATRIEGSLKVHEIPETEEEKQAAYEALRRPQRDFKPLE
jgi:hypothetical protein